MVQKEKHVNINTLLHNVVKVKGQLNLNQINHWCINYNQCIQIIHESKKIMHASNWKKRPLEVLKRIKTILWTLQKIYKFAMSIRWGLYMVSEFHTTHVPRQGFYFWMKQKSLTHKDLWFTQLWFIIVTQFCAHTVTVF